MNLHEIKTAVDAGKKVCWSNVGYQVQKDQLGKYLITYTPNQHSIGLTWMDGVTMNGEEKDFFILEEAAGKIS